MTNLLTVSDLADLMGWSTSTVYQRRYRGASLPPSISIGNTVRYRRQDVEDWLAAHRQEQSRGPDDTPTA